MIRFNPYLAYKYNIIRERLSKFNNVFHRLTNTFAQYELGFTYSVAGKLNSCSPISTILGHKGSQLKGTFCAQFYPSTLNGTLFIYWKVNESEGICDCVISEVVVLLSDVAHFCTVM